MFFTFIADGIVVKYFNLDFPGLAFMQSTLSIILLPFYFFLPAFFEFDLNTFIYVDVKYMFTHVTRDGLMLIMGIVHRLCNNLKSFNGSFFLLFLLRISDAKEKMKICEKYGNFSYMSIVFTCHKSVTCMLFLSLKMFIT